MELINASGTRVSLLNDTPYPSLRPRVSDHSRTFSYRSQSLHDDASHSLSSGQHTPATPELTSLRSESSHSTEDIQTPTSPSYMQNVLEHHVLSPPRQTFPYDNNFAPNGQPDSILMSHATGDEPGYLSHMHPNPLDSIEYKPQPPRLNIRTSTFPASPESISPGVDPVQPKKKNNKFPCPEWRNGCTDLFTTSGHAARHGKKHSGEKNVLCPVCNKAFTRKDNMKQHQRTHENGRGSSSKAKLKDEPRLKRTKQKQQVEQRQRQRTSSTGSIQSSLPITEQHPDTHPVTPSRTGFRYPTPPTRDTFQDLPLRSYQASQSRGSADGAQSCYGDTSSLRHRSNPLYSQPLSAGLDVLAIAASGVS